MCLSSFVFIAFFTDYTKVAGFKPYQFTFIQSFVLYKLVRYIHDFPGSEVPASHHSFSFNHRAVLLWLTVSVGRFSPGYCISPATRDSDNSVRVCHQERCATFEEAHQLSGTHPQRGGCHAAAPPNPAKPIFRKHVFFRYYYDIKSFTWFTLQPKSATEIGWRLVH
jgi:hypothetical protein